MMMGGMFGNRRGLWEPPLEDQQPGFGGFPTGGGAPGVLPQVPQADPNKLSTTDKIGAIGSLISTNLGGAQSAPLLQMIMQRQQERRQQQQYQQRLQDERTTWEQQQEYKTAHPEPRYFEANNGDQYAIGPDGQPKRLFADPTPKTTWQAVDNGDGTKTLMPFVNGMPVGGGAASAPAASAGGLPPGYTIRQGGAPSQGARTFPVR